MSEYTAPDRNYAGIQFETVRRVIEPAFTKEHDLLTQAYYSKTEYLSGDGTKWGILDRATFDKLHGLIFHMLKIAFHEHNLSLDAKEQIPQEFYNAPPEGTNTTPVQSAQAAVDAAAGEGFSLTIDWQAAAPAGRT